MKNKLPKYPRILSLAPSNKGFGFAVIEGVSVLANWGVRSVKGDKNEESIRQVRKLIRDYEPDVIVLEDPNSTRRSPRIRELAMKIAHLATTCQLPVVAFSRGEVIQTFLGKPAGSRHDVAQKLATQFPEELGFDLPPKRKHWLNENYYMDMFDAVALGLMIRSCVRRKRSKCAVIVPGSSG
jgi:Holliday junction resolvasome RuvABC endonuclease subunit